jgi:signal transduction histidine kinase
MRSIRLSLLVYFLALLGLALGLVSLLAYGITHDTLLEKKGTAARLIASQYAENCRKEKEHFDNALKADAKTLASRAHLHVPDGRPWYEHVEDYRRQQVGRAAATPALLTAGPVPLGLVLAEFTSLAEGARPLAEIRLDKVPSQDEAHLEGPPPAEYFGQVAEYVQIQCNFPFPPIATFRSESLHGQSLALTPEVMQELPNSPYSEVKLAAGETVRRIVWPFPIRTTHPAGSSQPPPSAGPWPRPPGRRPDAAARERPGPNRNLRPPWCTLQCGYSTQRRDEKIREFAGQRDEELANLETETEASLARLRTILLGVGLGTFAAVVVGVFFLVRLGLMPLRRLSDAVSRVSEKDFRLKFDGRRLPAELTPIVDRLRQTLDQLQRAFAREKQAAADISHELRTPVAALLTTIEVALRKPRKPEEYREVLQDCHDSGQQISQLVERLLTLARLDAGVDRLRVEEVDAAGLAEQCTALVRPLAEARGLALRLHCDGPALLKADSAKLREVLTNLLHNAIEYNRPDGSVDLSVGRDNGTLCVEVRDTGIGIAPEARAHLFERFYRADPSRHAEGLHAGLGLAIVKG